ncbi:DNA/RNA non-specific endonuclease [Acidovorax sp. NO-1]|nr:DNA/RNA non-specific endonuclease [Acidovorax sp. NO-1]
MYVITGPVFTSESERIGPGGVRGPTYMYKLVYDATADRAWTHWQAN